ncbi:hypothetical protein C7212DRAFT_193464, partial [Tuber magnatum]
IMVWGCFVSRHKGLLVIWNKAAWGKTMNAQGYQTHILPHLNIFCHEESTCTQDYAYIQQGNASPYRAHSTITKLQHDSFYNYLLPWPATSPDMNPIELVWKLIKSCIRQLLP